MKWFYKREWKSMQRFEKKINKHFEAKTIISDFDKSSLPFTTDQVTVVPNGVDAQFYKPQNVAKEFDILFSGNLNYQPNIDAALRIINELTPLLTKTSPNIKIGIAGRTDNKTLLAANNNNIKIIPVVEDMRDMYARTKIYIAPLFTGAGLQNKLLEAMSMGIPCIATQITNLSLQAKNNYEIIEVKDIDELSTAIIDLMNMPEKQQHLGMQGQAFIHNNFSWESANEKLKALILKQL